MIINVELDDGVRGSKVTFGGREMVNFAFADRQESGKMDLDQVLRLMIAQRKKGRPLAWALGLNDITMMAQRYHDDHVPSTFWSKRAERHQGQDDLELEPSR